MLQEELKKSLNEEKANLEKSNKTKMNDFVNSINNHYKNISLLLLKGCFISNKSYDKIRLLLSFKMNQEETIILRSKLPKIAKKPNTAMYVNTREKEGGRRLGERRNRGEFSAFFNFESCKIINTIVGDEKDIQKVIWKDVYSKV